MNAADLVFILQQVLREACEGPDDPKFTWFNANDKDSGVVPVLAKISASDASREPSPRARSIAAHAAHAAFHLKSSAAWLAGDKSAADWESSWQPQTVDDAAWRTVQDEFRRQYLATIAAIDNITDWNRDMLGGAIGAIAHAAYHLGAIRQILRQLKA